MEQALQKARNWYASRGWQMFPFQEEMIRHYLAGNNGILNAPTGSGKTLAMWIPMLLTALVEGEQSSKSAKGLQVIWITPLRALSQDILQATRSATAEMGLDWRIETRTGDTSSSQKQKQKRSMPQGLITTPESLHVLFASKGHAKLFKDLKLIVVDEWHELLGSKRGVQMELAIGHLRNLSPNVRIWGISATIGNIDQAMDVLLGSAKQERPYQLVQANIQKRIEVQSLLPDTIERFPWSGHLGITMVDKIIPILKQSRSTLIFTNTRAQCEIWYQVLLDAYPDFAGIIAMHHGAIDRKLRNWVEDALHNEQLKVVVCTSSLDLGVDFRPVETIIQIGGPKGVARFVQRAGRSGHRPGALSKIYFVPTHSLELIEAAALREAVANKVIESRVPVVQAHDVLLQYLVSLAVADGFKPEAVYQEVTQTYCFQDLSREEYNWMLDFLTTGGKSLFAYENYHKIEIEEDGTYKVNNKQIARQHRLSIGTIVSDISMTIKYVKGGRLGTVEESFVSGLKPGDIFWFSGRPLELVKIRNTDVLVRRSKSTKGKVPRWMGARMLLSSQLADLYRQQLDSFLDGDRSHEELERLVPLFQRQQQWSTIPRKEECLVESIRSREGHHLFIYPFEGRVVHEILGTLMAYRIAQLQPMSFSIAMNDYGFELLSDQEIPFEEALEAGLFSTENLSADISYAINQTEMVSRRFREIAHISGLLFKGYPGKVIKSKHLQASAALLFKIFKEYDPENLLLQQAHRETLDHQIDESRLHKALKRLSSQRLLLTEPPKFTPFCFPIMVDRLRERLSSEKLVNRVKKMQLQLEKY
ncbi:MAG: ligase-associated DNA damage response DEXH box helicase [Bacteroidota bacterium]